MEKRICILCNKEYIVRAKNQKYCSSKCREIAYENIPIKRRNKTDIEYVKCANCGKIFEKSYNVNRKKFCTDKCRAEFQKNKRNKKKTVYLSEIRKCDFCGKNFQWFDYNPRKRFCSKECREKFNFSKREEKKETRDCLFCGNDFEWSSFHPNQKFCSKKCRLKYTTLTKKNIDEESIKANVYEKVFDLITRMKNVGNSSFGRTINYSLLGDIPNETRIYVLNRDSKKCFICNYPHNLQLHHIVKRIDGGDHSPSNLITLCSKCHRHIETGDIEHAYKKCLKNALRNFNYQELEEQNFNKYDLACEIFSYVSEKVKDETELLVMIDELLSSLEREVESNED